MLMMMGGGVCAEDGRPLLRPHRPFVPATTGACTPASPMCVVAGAAERKAKPAESLAPAPTPPRPLRLCRGPELRCMAVPHLWGCPASLTP